MPKRFSAQLIYEAMQLAFAAGVTRPQQIKRAVRRRGTWFITCEVPA